MPSVKEVLKARVRQARMCSIKWFTESHWEIADNEGQYYDVDIDADHYSCTCNIFLLHWLPCEHLIAASSNQVDGANITVHDFCSNWYSIEQYKMTCAPSLRHIPDNKFWKWFEGVVIEPPVPSTLSSNERSRWRALQGKKPKQMW